MNQRSVLLVFLLLGFFEWLIATLSIPAYLLPRPSQVLITLWSTRFDLFNALLETSTHTFIGLAISFLTGTLFAIAISWSPWLKAGVLPLALFFQTVPIIAIAPMLVIWFGFGAPTVIASATIVSFFPILASTLQGIEGTPQSTQELFKLYQATTFQTYLKLRLPYAIPWIYGGLRIAAGLSVVGALVGEFIGGGGLGSLIDSARTQQRTDLVFAAVFTSCGLGWVLTFSLDLIQKKLLRRWFSNL